LRLGARQHCGRVDVLPPGISDIDRTSFALRRHRSHSIGKAAICVAFYAFKMVENVRRADKKTCIDRIVVH